MMWESPHQDERVIRALQMAEIETSYAHRCFAHGLGGELSAWELDISAGEAGLPWPAYRFQGLCEYSDVEWTLGSYFTLLMAQPEDHGSELRRKRRVGARAGLRFLVGEEALPALCLFNPHPELRASLDMPSMAELTKALLELSAGVLFAVYDKADHACFCGLALRSNSLLNIRFSAVDRHFGHLQPSRFGLCSLQEAYPGHRIDLSGITPPDAANEKHRSINRFKLELGSEVGIFRKEPSHASAEGDRHG